MADTAVESANIVGYQDLTGTSGDLISVAPTFVGVGDKGITLADIAVNEAGKEGGVKIRFFDTYGNALSEGDYIYVDATLYGGDEDGWYLEDTMSSFEFDASYCRNSTKIPAGTGFVLIPTAEGASLKFKGEVKQDVKEVTGTAGDLIRIGNASPVDFTLADIAVNEAGKEGGVKIRFFDTYGNALSEGDYIYVDATLYGGDEDGWYLEDTMSSFEFDASYCRNSTKIPAGTGFVLIPTAEGATIVIPNPMTGNSL